jgi:hypothetical protein
MFQVTGPGGRELLIHDMKQLDQLNIHLRTVLHQLEDPHILAAARELLLGETIPFIPASPSDKEFVYNAPTPEFQ